MLVVRDRIRGQSRLGEHRRGSIIKKPFVGDERAEKANVALAKIPRFGSKVVVPLRR